MTPSRSTAESELQWQLHCLKIPFESEYRFAKPRRWRFDLAFPEPKIAVEIEGLTSGYGGRHQRKTGFENDLLKYDEAARLGWFVYRCSSKMVYSGQAINTIQLLLSQKSGDPKAAKKSHGVRK